MLRVADDVVGAPDGMLQRVGPADQEFTAIKDSDVRRGGIADANRCTGEGDGTGRCFRVILADGVVTGPIEGVGDVGDRVPEPEKGLGEKFRLFGDPRPRMMRKPIAGEGEGGKRDEEDRAELQRNPPRPASLA